MIDGFYAVDYQVHSFRSHDGRASIADQCARAVALGLDEIGFSEHKDFDPADPVVDYFDYKAYLHEIEAARRTWEGRLTIRAGVEIDYQIWFEDRIADYLRSHHFDFVLGSVHYVDRQMLMTPEYNSDRSRETAYRDYFHAVQELGAQRSVRRGGASGVRQPARRGSLGTLLSRCLPGGALGTVRADDRPRPAA